MGVIDCISIVCINYR